jgi:hypothetical protein
MNPYITQNHAGGFDAPAQARAPDPAAAQPVAPAAQPARSLLDAARAEAHAAYLAARSNPNLGYGDREKSRLKWLMRLPHDYDFRTNAYRWALSPAQRAHLPPPVEAPEPELRDTSRAYPFALNRPATRRKPLKVPTP